MNSIKLVHVVFKTHLDIGYTDLAARVTDNYINRFIPGAIKTAQELRKRGGKERFVWTTGSWLIHTFLKRADKENKEKLIDAIKQGDIAWHACPFTTHTELMSAKLCDYGLSLSARLDKQFNKKTVAAKMTDVPGHTIGLVPLLAKRGISYLHIGVNGGSYVPEVPRVFKWRSQDGSEVYIQYDGSYGETLVLPGVDEALVIVNALDNNDPPDADAVIRTFADLSQKFPGAEIRASTLDAFVPALKKTQGIPVLTEEIADTWIHGIGSDPMKTSKFKDLMRLGEEWEKQGKLKKDTDEYNNFYDELIMIAEHTWGMDIKIHLSDYLNWSVDDFHKARKEGKVKKPDYVTEFMPHYSIVERILTELYPNNPEYRERQDYHNFESSHKEQRAYNDSAIACLPEELQKEAEISFKNLLPQRELISHTYTGTETLHPGKEFSLGPWHAIIGNGGELISLKTDKGKEMAGIGGIGLYSYQTFSHDDYMQFHQNYNRYMSAENIWMQADFGKPGMQYANPPPRHAFFTAYIHSITMSHNEDYDEAAVLLKACSETPRGAPQTLIIRYQAAKTGKLEICLDWFDKEANKLPEAIWFSINLNTAIPSRWRYSKLGILVNPLDVVRGGNRHLHGIEYAEYKGYDGEYRITPLDSVLASTGARKMVKFDHKFEDLASGIHFNIYNNTWGTNFPAWYEEDGRSRFIIEGLN